MEPIDLILLQLSLERIGLNQQAALVRIPGPDPDDIAHLYGYHYQQTYRLFFRHDVDPERRRQIEQLSPESVFTEPERILSLLGDDCTTVNQYKSYTFAGSPDPGPFPDVVMQEKNQRLMAVILRNGAVVSACTASRESEDAAECYVYTEPEYRGRGFARQTTAAWGSHLLRQGKTVFYSHTLENRASQGVAQSLGLVPCFTMVNYD